jgi:hypothetical protein
MMMAGSIVRQQQQQADRQTDGKGLQRHNMPYSTQFWTVPDEQQSAYQEAQQRVKNEERGPAPDMRKTRLKSPKRLKKG